MIHSPGLRMVSLVCPSNRQPRFLPSGKGTDFILFGCGQLELPRDIVIYLF